MREALTVLSEAFEGPFRGLATELARRHPEARFQVRRDPVGTATAFQGYTLYVECFWPGRGPDEPDNVVLEIELCHLSTAPRVNADVCWGHGRVEAEFASGWQSSDDWPPATPAVLGELSVRMPDLMAAFRQAVARGAPAE